MKWVVSVKLELYTVMPEIKHCVDTPKISENTTNFYWERLGKEKLSILYSRKGFCKSNSMVW